MKSVETLRAELFNYIRSMDEKSLRVIHAMVGAYIDQQDEDFWDELSPEQKETIQQSRREHREGKGIPHSDVMKEFRKKYSK